MRKVYGFASAKGDLLDVIPQQAAVVQEIYGQDLSSKSLGGIADFFESNFHSKLGGGYLKERKKPAPHAENPLAHDLKVRVDNKTLGKVEFCMKEFNLTRSVVLQKGVNTLYEQLQNKRRKRRPPCK